VVSVDLAELLEPSEPPVELVAVELEGLPWGPPELPCAAG
jgi:hypothetical protein